MAEWCVPGNFRFCPVTGIDVNITGHVGEAGEIDHRIKTLLAADENEVAPRSRAKLFFRRTNKGCVILFRSWELTATTGRVGCCT